MSINDIGSAFKEMCELLNLIYKIHKTCTCLRTLNDLGYGIL